LLENVDYKDNTKIKLAMFDGKQRNYVVWEEKFIARAYKTKYADILIGTVEIPKFKEDYDHKDKAPDEAMSDKSTTG